VNETKAPLLLIRLKLVDENGERVLPVHWSENYISLMPGESRVVKFDAPAAKGKVTVVQGETGLRSTTPDPWGGSLDSWQMKRHAEKMAIVKNGGAKVVFIGDSITHLWESRGKEQIAKYFSNGDWKMLNLGTGGDRTEHVIWRLENGELDGYEAKFIFVMIGTNNTGHRSLADESPDDTVAGIRKILGIVRKKQPKALVVLSAIFPRGETPEDPLRRRNDAVNAKIKDFADGKNVLWLDFSSDFLDGNGNLPKSLFPDLLHPTAAGYEIWYAAVKPYVEYALSDRRGPKPDGAAESNRSKAN